MDALFIVFLCGGSILLTSVSSILLRLAFRHRIELKTLWAGLGICSVLAGLMYTPAFVVQGMQPGLAAVFGFGIPVLVCVLGGVLSGPRMTNRGMQMWRRSFRQYRFKESSVAGAALGYRELHWKNNVLITWHTSPVVRTHSDIIRREQHPVFARRYSSFWRKVPAERLTRDVLRPDPGACWVSLAAEMSEYLNDVTDSAPVEYAGVLRLLISSGYHGNALVPSEMQSAELPGLGSQWVFPAVAVKSLDPAHFTVLEYKPRAVELATRLCSVFGSGFVLVYPERSPEDAFASGGSPQTCLLKEPEAVASAVLEAMIPLPFIGFVMSEDMAVKVSGKEGLDPLERSTKEVTAFIVGIFDGESFAVYTRDAITSADV